jgi:hypothetical protein
VIENVTAKNYVYGFLQLSASNTSLTVKNVEVKNVNYGFKIDYSNGVTMERVTVTDARYYGIYDSNFGTKTYTITNSNISSIEIWERPSVTNTTTFNFVGDNTVGTLEASEYAKYVLADVNSTLTAPEGQNVTTNVADYKVAYENNTYFLVAKDYVAEINGNKFESIQEAINAAQDGDTIIIIADHELTEIVKVADRFAYPVLVDVQKTVTIDLNGKIITANAPVNAEKFSGFDLIAAIYVGGNGNLTLTDSVGGGAVSVTAGDTSKIYSLLMADGADANMLIESGHYELDRTANQSLVYAGYNQTITVTGGTFVLGNADPATSKAPWIFNAGGQGVAAVTVTGGTYNVDPTHYHGEAHFPMGYLPVKNADGTWTVVKGNVYNKTIGQTFLTIADAMADAMTTEGDDHIVLLRDHTESVVLIYNGTTLDLQTYTLKVDYLVSFNGGYITGAVRKSSATYAKLIVPKQFIALAENAATLGAGYVLPVWDKNENAFVFGQLATKTIADGVRESGRFEGKEELFTQFVINGSPYVKKTLMLDQASSGLHVEVVASWNPIVNGIVSTDTITQVYRFSDESLYKNLVENYDLSASVMLDGHENLTMYIRLVSDTGVVVNMGYVSAN